MKDKNDEKIFNSAKKDYDNGLYMEANKKMSKLCSRVSLNKKYSDLHAKILLVLAIREPDSNYFSEALKELNKVAPSQKSLLLGRYYLEANNLDKSYEEFSKLLNTDKEEYALLGLGKIALKKDNLDKYLECLNRLAIKHNSHVGYLELGKYYKKEGEYLKAIDYFNSALKSLDNKNKGAMAPIIYELGKTYNCLKDTVKAKEYFNELLNTQSMDYGYLELARIEISTGNNSLAEYYLDQIKKEDFIDVVTLERANIYKNQNKDEDAIKLYKSLLNSNVKLEAALSLARLYTSSGYVDDAEKYYKYIVDEKKFDNIYYLALINLGKIYYMTGKYSDADEIFKSVLNTRYNDMAVSEITKHLSAMGQIDNAIEFLESNTTNYSSQYYYERAKLYADKCQYNEAILSLNRVDEYPTVLYAILLKGNIYLNLGDKEKAYNCYSELDKVNFKYAVPAIAYYYNRIGEYDKAEQYILDNISNSNKNHCLFELVKLYACTNRFSEALDTIDKLKNTKYYYLALFEKYKILIRLERYEEALKLYEEYKDIKTIFNGSKNVYINIIYKMGLIDKDNFGLSTPNYYVSQLIDYNRESALNHISKHRDYDIDELIHAKRVHTKFNDSIDIEKVYDYVKDCIKDNDPYINGNTDKYFIKMDNIIGSVDNVDVDVLEILTISNTKDIISMYPCICINDKIIIKPNEKIKD